MSVRSRTVTVDVEAPPPRVRSHTVTVEVGLVPPPPCPYWMRMLYEFSVEHGLERLQRKLESMAEDRGCSLAEV